MLLEVLLSVCLLFAYFKVESSRYLKQRIIHLGNCTAFVESFQAVMVKKKIRRMSTKTFHGIQGGLPPCLRKKTIYSAWT